MTDKNFDDLVDRFTTNIYQSPKGQIRLAVVKEDLRDFIPSQPARILDAGGGLGGLAVELAEANHHVVYCDISANMLAQAQLQAEVRGVTDNMDFYHESIQSLLTRQRDFSLILCHAVLEWVAQPKQLLTQLVTAMPPGGLLSLLFYNKQSIVFRNLLRGNFFKATAGDQAGDKGSLTPVHPLNPNDVKGWLAAHNVEILLQSGVRVFYDYGEKDRLAQRTMEQIIATELAFSKQQPFRDLGRYYHLVIRKRAE